MCTSLNEVFTLLCFQKCHYKISKTPQSLIVLECAAVLRPHYTILDTGEAIIIQFITDEEGNVDKNCITALWLQLYLNKSISLLLCILTKKPEHIDYCLAPASYLI